MKQLYQIIPKVYLNDIELCDRGFYRYSLHYDEIPELDSLEFTNFDEAWNNKLLLCLCDISIFNKKYISGHIGLVETMCVSKKNFKSYVVKETLKTYKDKDYTITELARLLSATDFVDWCKDHNLNICPINNI